MGMGTSNGSSVKRLTPIGGYFGVIWRKPNDHLHLAGLDAETFNESLRFSEPEAYARRDYYRKRGCWAQVIQFAQRDDESLAELMEEYDDLHIVGDILGEEVMAEMRQHTSLGWLRDAADEATAHTASERCSARSRA